MRHKNEIHIVGVDPCGLNTTVEIKINSVLLSQLRKDAKELKMFPGEYVQEILEAYVAGTRLAQAGTVPQRIREHRTGEHDGQIR